MGRGDTMARWRALISGREVTILILLGLAVRIAWVFYYGKLGHAGGEASNVAIALAQGGFFGDTFGKGSGPSAHFTPSMALVTAAAYAAFGVQTAAAEIVLGLISITLSLGGAWVWYHVFGELGAPRFPRLAALAFFCLLPLNALLEVVSFRAWEGALAVLLAGLALLQTVRADKAEHIPLSRLALVAVLCALTFYVNPASGLAAYTVFGLLLLRRVAVRRWPSAVLVAVVSLLVVLTPWTIRNYAVFDRFIPLRSNFGLELALANHPDALNGKDPQQVFLDRLNEIHPQESQSAFDVMQSVGGEAAFAERLGKEARDWIVANPADFARLSFKHLSEFYFPPQWLWDIYRSNTATAVGPRQILVWGLSLLGLIAAFALPLLRGARFLYVSVFILIPALPYVIVQPVPRYRYLIFAPVLYASIYLILLVAARFRSNRLKVDHAYE